MEKITNTLSDSRNPLMLIKGKEILWANQAAAEYFDIKECLPQQLQNKLNEVRLNPALTVFDISLDYGKLQGKRLSVVPIDMSSGDPDSDEQLLAFSFSDSYATSYEEKEELLATVAHDIKNPLGAIFGYADTLLDTALGAGFNAAQRDVVARIRGTAARAVDLVRNYQHLTNLDLRGLPKSSTIVELNETIRSVIDSTWREDPFNPLLAFEPSKEKLRLRIEKVHLERIISNLFSNALKYTPKSERILIHTGVHEKDRSNAILSITNTGVVIDAEDLPHLFERYRRAATSSGTVGSGLGLYIVKLIVDGLGGKVEVRSDKINGTIFEVLLPRELQ